MKTTQIRLGEMREKLRLSENVKFRRIEDRLKELKHELGIFEGNRFNLMKIFGIEARESPHSKFLLWLLNPNETHGLGDEFLLRFVKLVASRRNKESVVTSIQYDILRVERESVGDESRLDIKIYDSSKTFLCVLENKIKSGEAPNQTRRLYRDNHDPSIPNEFFVYLTLPGREGPKDPEMSKIWIHITYNDISTVLKSLIKTSLNLNTKYVLNEYLKNLGELISLSEFKGFGEKTKLYLKYYSDIRTVRKAWKKELELFLEFLRTKLEREKQNWPEPDSWEIEIEGRRMSVWKKSWEAGEEYGVYFWLSPTRSEQGFSLYFYVDDSIRSHFNPEFNKLLEKKFGEQKFIGKGNFQRGSDAYILGCLIKIDFGIGEKFVDHVAETFTEAVELFSGLIDKVMLKV